ncbi:MAG: UDP-3-O-(3-hydroxymyristoyl)glucosamine N-acyltransferase [Planctomycetes bacterium HGW-Planctomycetes-1]|nr:MAG: UDP-3-O-(3-hydroxymyristoyl)glucosamine N-acyltransferase [Planctomycetes bacterium HGW-Planctomycetes-1]
MTDSKKITVNELANILKARLIGSGLAEVRRVSVFDSAGSDSVAFAAEDKLLEKISQCKAAAVIVNKEVNSPIPLLVVDNVERALIETLKQFMPPLGKPAAGIHKTAAVEQGATVDKTASIGPLACIKTGAKIGERTVIGAGAKIGENSVIGNDCRLEDNVVVYHNCSIGNNCVIAANSTIGATGFGYYFINGRHQLIPHTGSVIIEDCVEIGANSCIDRAKFGNTVIGAGTKIDNLVHIAHNVILGKCCLIAAQAGIAGSTKLGNGVVLAGQVGIKDHITIGDGTQVGAQAGVINDIGPNIRVVGSPAIDAREFFKQVLLEQRLPEMSKQLKQLVKRVEELEAAKNNS